MDENQRLQEQIIKILTENPSITGYDSGTDQADMAMTELRSISDDAIAISKLIDKNTILDAWVSSKITKAADYLNSVQTYLKSRP